MPTLTFQHELLNYIQSSHGVEYDSDDWLERFSQIGCVVEKSDSEGIEIEIFPDRPDLLSHETIARAARSFLNAMEYSPNLSIKEGDITLTVDSSLEKIRPVIYGAIVRGVNIGDTTEEKNQFIQSLMDHQEKLHLTLGRKRRLASIGVHDLNTIKPPFQVQSVPKSHSFIPLATEDEMTIEEILTKHPKGVEYAHLMEGLEAYPVITDDNDNILSFPPIINGAHTTVTKDTTDFFIDVTGWDERACEACLLLVTLSLAERGGIVESVNLSSWEEVDFQMPNGEAKIHRVPDNLITKVLGMKMESEDIADSIKKMGGILLESRTVTDGPDKALRWSDCAVGEREHLVAMPRWRSDIMHPIDIVEDIAIGFGYSNMPEQLSTVHLDAIPLKSSQLRRRVSASLCSQGLQETQSLTLSNPRDQFDRIRWSRVGETTDIANPITVEHTMLRQYILPSLLNLLSANRHHELPQRVHELGTVVRDSANQTRAAWACAEVSSGFSSAKGIAQALLRDLGADLEQVKYIATKEGEGPWINGRGAKIILDEEEIGQFGELDPIVGHEFGLRVPIHAGEFDIDAIGRIIPDPVI